MATKNKKRKKRIIWLSILGLLVLWFVAARVFRKEPLESVTAEHPAERTIVEIISANGRVQPVTEVKISPDVSGEIVELHVAEGEQVAKGQLLIKIKPDTYQSMQQRAEASLNSSRAQLEQNRAQLKLAEQTYARQKQLFEQQVISEADFQAATADYNRLRAAVSTAEYNIQSARASLAEANENLYKTTIFAPSSGTISKLNVELGERVVGTATMAGTELLRLADLSQMEVRADVNENDIVRVELGDTATIEIDAYLGRKFTGVVTRIGNSANSAYTASSDQITNFEVRIYILPGSYADLVGPKGQSPFRPGMSASVDIQTATTRALSIPLQAVTTRNTPDGEKQEVVFLYGADSSIVRQVAVKTGIQDRKYIAVEAGTGIDTAVMVVTGPFLTVSKILADRQRVQITEAPAVASPVQK